MRPRALILSLLMLLALPSASFAAQNSLGPVPDLACDQSVAVNISTATTTGVVAPSGTKIVYVCAFSLYVVSGTTPGFKFQRGAGTACATNPTDLSGVYGGIAGAVGQLFDLGSGLGAVMQTASGEGFCIVSSGTTPNIQGFVRFAQL